MKLFTHSLRITGFMMVILFAIMGPLHAQIYASTSPVIDSPQYEKRTLPLKEALVEIEEKYGINISYKSDLVGEKKVEEITEDIFNIEKELGYLLDQSNLQFKKIDEKAYVIIAKNKRAGAALDDKQSKRDVKVEDVILTMNIQNIELQEVFSIIEGQTNLKFSYDPSGPDGKRRINLKEQNASLESILRRISDQTGVSFKRVNSEIFVSNPYDPGASASVSKSSYETELSGKVIDASGEALPGVNVIIEGTLTGTVTDVNGEFKLLVSNDATLVVSFIGFVTQKVTVGAQQRINITLVADTKELDEVIVVGYGEQRKSDVTGSVVSLNEKNFNKGANVSVDQLIAGRVAGVQMTKSNGEPGGGFSVRIRGSSSITAGNDPLYVIDGFPIDNSPLLSSAAGAGVAPNNSPRNPLNSINPSDIESVEILKDASATAIYGSRGANGVILITTKKGSKGATEVDYNFYGGVQTVAKKLDVMDRDEYIQAINDISVAEGKPKEFSDAEIANIKASGVNTNWQNEIFRTAPVFNHAITVKGGQNKTQYYASFNYFNQAGVIISSGIEKYILRLSLNQQVGEKVKLGFNVNSSFINDDYVSYGQGSVTSSDVINASIDFEPTQPIYDANGNYTGSRANFQMDNAVAIANLIDTKATTSRTLANSSIEYTIIPGLTAKGYFGADIQNQRRDVYVPSTLRRTLGSSNATIATLERNSYIIEATANYNKVLVKGHSLSALLGYTFQEFSNRTFDGSISNFTSDITKTNNLSLGQQSTAKLNSNTEGNTLLSYLGRVNYNFQDRLLLTASYRIDGSSRFGSNNKYGYFPSVALGWRLENESFISNLKVFDQLKIRASWGQTGNQSIGNFGSLGTLTGGNAVIGNTLVTTAQPARIPNPDLKWESTTQSNVGIDYGFLDGRISGSIDYFQKRTDDLLLNLPIPVSTGFQTILSNAGSVKNTGWEFTIASRNLTGKFGWTTSFNLTHIKNEVISLGDDIKEIVTGTVGFTSQFALVRPGEAMYSYYGHQVTGIFQNQAQIDVTPKPASGAKPGNPIYADINHDGVIDSNDRTVLGSPFPDFTWGLNNSFTYKNFQFDIFFNAQSGSSVLNNNLMLSLYPANTPINRLAEPILNRWTPSNPSNQWPSSVNPSSYGVPEGNSLIILNNSFVRLNNAQISYRFPSGTIRWLRSATVFVSGQNLLTWTNYLGFNPEVNSYGNSGIVVDYNSYPTARTYTIGFNLGF